MSFLLTCTFTREHQSSQTSVFPYVLCLRLTFSYCFFKIQESREIEKPNQQKSQSPAIQVPSKSPKICQFKHSYQEGKPTAPISVELTNGEPERAGSGDEKLEQDLALSASGEQE